MHNSSAYVENRWIPRQANRGRSYCRKPEIRVCCAGPALPEVASVAGSGFPGYEDYTWQAFFAPAGTPRAIVDKLNRSIAAILQLPDTKERLAVLGYDPIDNTPAEFAAYIKTEVTKWAKVI